MEYAVSSLSLKNVVIGCRTDSIFDQLCSSLDGTACEELGHGSRDVSNSSDASTFLKNWTQSKGFGKKLYIQYGKPLPAETLQAFGIRKPESSLESPALVLSTAPFSYGYINHNTEIVIVKIPNEIKTRSAHRRRKSPPIVSHFLTEYELKSVKREKALVAVEMLDDKKEKSLHESNPDYDVQSAIVMGFDQAHRFGVMNGSFMLVRIHDAVKRRRRPMQVIVSSELSGSDVIMMSWVAWYNLDGRFLDEDPVVSVKKICPESPSSTETVHMSPSSSSILDLCDSITQAKRVTISQINQVSDTMDILPAAGLKEYFSRDRFLSVGDVFVIQCEDHDGQYCTKMMKVKKINNSNKTKQTYKINEYTSVFEDSAVNGYILPDTSRDPVTIGNAFLQIRSSLLRILKPFVDNAWSPSPLPLILLSGAEGSGKSLVVHQVAHMLQSNYLEINCVHLVCDTITSTENRIRELLTKARSFSPAVVLLRNIHTLTRDEINNVENPRIAQTFYSIVEETVNSSEFPVILFGTCEQFKTVSEVIREMALHEVVFESPDVEQRLVILEELCDELSLHPAVCLSYLADHTAGYLYGDLRALVTHARRNAVIKARHICKKELGYFCEKTISQSHIFMTQEDFAEALNALQSLQSLDLGAPKIPNVHWSDIGGLQQVKTDILDTIQLPLKHPELFLSTMRRSGILLYGPPGTGKTLLAKAVATECSLNFFSVKGPELINMYVGQSEENVRQVFQKARGASPCVIFFDELDSLAPNRGKSGDSGGVMDRVVSQLLAELDGLHKSGDVFVIGATNRPDLLDPALLRPGRFDKLVYIGITTTPLQQCSVLRAITRNFNMSPDCDLETISQQLPANLTGADLYSLCAEAVTNGMQREIAKIESGTPIDDCKLLVTQSDFLLAVKNIVPSLSIDEIARYEQVRRQFSQQTKKEIGRRAVRVDADTAALTDAVTDISLLSTDSVVSERTDSES